MLLKKVLEHLCLKIEDFYSIKFLFKNKSFSQDE